MSAPPPHLSGSAPDRSRLRRSTVPGILGSIVVVLVLLVPQPAVAQHSSPGVVAAPHVPSTMVPTWKQFSNPLNVSATSVGPGYMVWDQAEQVDIYWVPNSALNDLYFYYPTNDTWRVGAPMYTLASNLSSSEWIIGAAYNWQDGVIDVSVQSKGTCAPAGEVCFFAYAHGWMKEIGSFVEATCYGLSVWDAADHAVWWISTGSPSHTYTIINNTVTQSAVVPPSSNCNSGNAVWDSKDGYVMYDRGAGYGYETYVGGVYTSIAAPYPCDTPLMAFDPASGVNEVVSYGCAGFGETDQYLWNGAAWTDMGVPSGTPSDSQGYTEASYDPVVGRTLFLTGDSTNGANGLWGIGLGINAPLTATAAASPAIGPLGTTFTFTATANGGTPPYSWMWRFADGGSSASQNITHTYSQPGTYTVHLWVNDSASGRVLLPLSVTVYAPIFRNWTEICAQCGPPARGDGPLAYDPVGGFTLLFGGGISSTAPRFNDTWMFKGGIWTQLHPAHSPGALQGANLIWDPTDNEFVLFGGLNSSRVLHNETWTFSNGDWTQLTTTHAPAPRYDASMVWDTADGYALLFGGCYVGCQSTFGDTWKFVGGSWTQLSPATSPSPRGWAFMTYDAADSEVVLFGGAVPIYTAVGDTWTFRAGTWTQLTPIISPSARWSGIEGFSYDPTLGYAVLYGGTSGAVSLSDTWAFKGGLWTQVTTAVNAGGNVDMGMTYDASIGGVIIFGNGQTITNQTWIFGPWTPAPLSVSLTAGPSPADVGKNVTAVATPSGGGGSLDYTFAFGDGTFVHTLKGDATHAFAAPGTYTVRVWLNDSGGQSAGAASLVSVNPALSLVVQASPNPAYLGAPVNFSTITLGGTSPYTYSWNFGDGGLGGNLANITHIYTTNGPFTATVTVADAAGSVTRASVSISIALQVSMSSNVTLGAAPLVAGFRSTVVGGVPGYTYAWSFGDGATSSLASPTHTYSTAGVFSARLLVSDSAGHTASRTWTITATPSGPLQMSVSATPNQFYLGNSTTITASPTGGRGGYTLTWVVLPNWCVALSLSVLNCTPTVSGSYTFQAEVSDAAGAQSTGQVTVQVLTHNTVGPKASTGFLGLSGSVVIDLVLLVAIAAVVVALLVTYETRRRSRIQRGGGTTGVSQAAPPPAMRPPSPPTAGDRRPIPPSGESDSLKDIF